MYYKLTLRRVLQIGVCTILNREKLSLTAVIRSSLLHLYDRTYSLLVGGVCLLVSRSGGRLNQDLVNVVTGSSDCCLGISPQD